MPAGWFLSEYLNSKGILIQEMHHNVNERYNDILNDIVSTKPDTLLLSIYIFNVILVESLIKDIRAILPDCIIIAGGPEADSSIDADHIIYGEGEQALYELLNKSGQKSIGERPLEKLDDIPSPYTIERIKKSQNKLIYYESSRGCPFHCSYCMASLSNGVRYFSLDRVKNDLINIVRSGAKIIKFTDRTFNADTKRTNAILEFILNTFHHKKVCFHFEVGGDLFKDSTLEILEKMPVGLIQIEAGVQTLNPQTLKAINRYFKKEVFIKNISRIIGYKNIHTHLDLIAGLPYDDMPSFIQSFNEVISIKPHNLQLGFLKFLKGTPIRKDYNASYSQVSPYEIICSPTMSKQDLNQLKNVEFVLNRIYNSGKFYYTLEYLLSEHEYPYDLFKDISDFFIAKGIGEGAYESTLYNCLLEYMNNSQKAIDYLRFDYLITNNSKKLPEKLKKTHSDSFKKFLAHNKRTEFVMHEEFCYLPFYHIKGNYVVRFDYSQKNPVDGQYRCEILENSI